MVTTLYRSLTLLLMVFSGTAVAGLQAHVDRNPVQMNESFTLTIEADTDVDGKPDLSVLEDRFDVLSQNQSSSIRMINGSISRSITWQLTLMPTSSGILTIPAFEVDGQRSEPISLKVLPAGSRSGPGTPSRDDEVILQSGIEPQESLYVQQQLRYTVRLFYRVNLAQGSSLTEPKVSGVDAVVEQTGKDREYQTTRNGRRYGVIERHYLIYPQQSGTMTIEPTRFDGRLVTGRSSSMFDPFSQQTRAKRLFSDSHTVEVKPIPAAFQGKQWLPARSVKLMEDWSQPQQGYRVGEPITRTVALMAEGLTAAQLPEVPMPVPDGIKRYPDQPELRDNSGEEGITGVRQQKVALIPTRSGRYTLPGIELPWWNVEQGRMEIARLPERTIEVAPAAAAQQQGAPAAPNAPVAPQQAEPADEQQQQTVVLETASPLWFLVSIGLGTGWLLTLLAWWWSRRRQGEADKSEPREPLTKPAPKLRNLEREIKRLSEEGDRAGLQQALLNWAAQKWPDERVTSLEQLARRADAEFARRLQILDASLYSPHEAECDCQALWRAFRDARFRDGSRVTRTPGALTPLIPQ